MSLKKTSYFWSSGVSFSSKVSGIFSEQLLTGHNFCSCCIWMKLKHSSLQILCLHGNTTGGEDSKGFPQLAHFPNFLECINLSFLIIHFLNLEYSIIHIERKGKFLWATFLGNQQCVECQGYNAHEPRNLPCMTCLYINILTRILNSNN